MNSMFFRKSKNTKKLFYLKKHKKKQKNIVLFHQPKKTCFFTTLFATQFWAGAAGPMLDSQKLVGSGPVQRVRWLRLWSRENPHSKMNLVQLDPPKINKLTFYLLITLIITDTVILFNALLSLGMTIHAQVNCNGSVVLKTRATCQFIA